MKNLFKRFSRSSGSLNTEFARARMQRSMPGETAALASLRYGGMSL